MESVKMLYREFNECGYPIFGLHGVTKDGMCECLNPNCTALYKHPRISNWQVTQVWEDEQIECMEMTSQLDTGYGVLCKGLIVIDVDARNGGVDSYSKLIEEIPEILDCGMIVETGSGGGSKHLFFKAPDSITLQSHLKDYQGIDFKSSGYVVGAGSRHISGNTYKVVFGSPDDISEAPSALIELLKAKERDRLVSSDYDGEISEDQIMDMLSVIDPDCDHETWVKIGMAIHHATGGAGFNIWDEWSAKGAKYPKSEILFNRWHSFGKSANPATAGTLIHFAKENGYQFQISGDDVTFESDIDWGDVPDVIEEEPRTARYHFDPLNPPNLVGRIARWINKRSMYPRENLAVAAALMAVSCAGGMRYRCEDDGIAANLFAFCVAGSGTGKESILQSFTLLMVKSGIVGAVHGSIKSEQEIFRNIIDNQAAFYTVDEIGEMLAKIQGARQRSGSASYLEGIFGALMGIYSKANGIQLITGDAKKALKKDLNNELSVFMQKKANNELENGDLEKIERLKKLIIDADSGIINPYLNILGFTAPTKFSTLLDSDMADNGFFARALIFRELDDNPPYKEEWVKPSDDDEELNAIGNILSNMYHAGHTSTGRIELLGDIEYIPSTPKAKALFKQIRQDFWEMGEIQKEAEGMVAYTRRGAEMVSRVALILSMADGERNEDHLMWAYEMIKADMKLKIMMTNANTDTDKGGAIVSRIMTIIGKNYGVTLAVIKNKLKNAKEDALKKAIDHLIDTKRITAKEVVPLRGKPTTKYYEA